MNQLRRIARTAQEIDRERRWRHGEIDDLIFGVGIWIGIALSAVGFVGMLVDIGVI